MIRGMKTKTLPENWYWLSLAGKTEDNLRNRVAASTEIGDAQDVANCQAELARRDCPYGRPHFAGPCSACTDS